MPKLLPQVKSPADLRDFTSLELTKLAAEIRGFLVETVSKTGGHLGPNLGVVELTIALHRVFNSPTDTILFDTGHQTYVHKLLTGRQDFRYLRSAKGLSGYPCREESCHDVIENSHASTALSWAQGIAQAKLLAGDKSYTVAVIGDGALTGGMAWEALNNIAEKKNLRLIVVVNDNGRSYAPTIGGLAHHLDAMRTSPAYERALAWGKKKLQSGGKPGELTLDALHGFKRGVQDVLTPQAMFTDLGIKYTGPINGHDVVDVEFGLSRAMDFRGPVIVHVITQKGRGYSPAENHEADRFHAIGPIHPETGLPIKTERFGWTAIVADELVRQGRTNPNLVAITAAMMEPVGLRPFAQAFPQRVFDVGIAEQHAMTMAAGLAKGGAHPVLALYATFMNRAFDQLLMDVALHQEAVTVLLDRSGITGADGPSHNGMWDIALGAMVPGLRLAAPRDAQTLRKLVAEALACQQGPTIVRYPKGSVPQPLTVVDQCADYDVLYRSAPNALSVPQAGTAGIKSATCTTATATSSSTTAVGTFGLGTQGMLLDGAESQVKPPVAKVKNVSQGRCVGKTSLTDRADASVSSSTQRDKVEQVGAKHSGLAIRLIAVGPLAEAAVKAGKILGGEGYRVEVVNPGWILPVPSSLVETCAEWQLIVTVEDGLVTGGFGTQLQYQLTQAGIYLPVLTLGIAKQFLPTDSRPALLAANSLDSSGIVNRVKAVVADLT